MDRTENLRLATLLGLVATLALSVLPLPESLQVLRPDWVAVLLVYWSLSGLRRVGLFTAFCAGLLLDSLTGALLGQHALALVIVAYLAERSHLRVRLLPLPQLAVAVLVMLGLYEFVLFWVDGIAGRTVPVVERWVPPLTGTLVWILMTSVLGQRIREARVRF